MRGNIKRILESQPVEFVFPGIACNAVRGTLPGAVAGVADYGVAPISVGDGQAVLSLTDHLHVGDVADAVGGGVFHNTALNLCQSCLSTEGLQVIVDKLAGCRSGYRRQ